MSGVPVRVTVVWVILIVATAATVWLGTDHPFVSAGAQFAPSLALTIAFAKAYLIGQDFMEVRAAPRTLRVAFGLWIGVFGTVVVILHAI